MVNDWVNSDIISLCVENMLVDGEVLSFLIEKDFKCFIDCLYEDESDLFLYLKDGEIVCQLFWLLIFYFFY